MRHTILLLMTLIASSAKADIVNSIANHVSEIVTFNEAESNASLDGDTLVRIDTGLTQCPKGVYIKFSAFASQVNSTVLAAYMAQEKVAFQVWNDSARFWRGSGTPYCQVRAVIIRR